MLYNLTCSINNRENCANELYKTLFDMGHPLLICSCKAHNVRIASSPPLLCTNSSSNTPSEDDMLKNTITTKSRPPKDEPRSGLLSILFIHVKLVEIPQPEL